MAYVNQALVSGPDPRKGAGLGAFGAPAKGLAANPFIPNKTVPQQGQKPAANPPSSPDSSAAATLLDHGATDSRIALQPFAFVPASVKSTVTPTKSAHHVSATDVDDLSASLERLTRAAGEDSIRGVLSVVIDEMPRVNEILEKSGVANLDPEAIKTLRESFDEVLKVATTIPGDFPGGNSGGSVGFHYAKAGKLAGTSLWLLGYYSSLYEFLKNYWKIYCIMTCSIGCSKVCGCPCKSGADFSPIVDLPDEAGESLLKPKKTCTFSCDGGCECSEGLTCIDGKCSCVDGAKNCGCASGKSCGPKLTCYNGLWCVRTTVSEGGTSRVGEACEPVQVPILQKACQEANGPGYYCNLMVLSGGACVESA